MVPFDATFAARSARGLRRRRPRRARSAPRTSRWARTSASATRPRATPRCSPPTTASRRASCRCWRSTARSSPPATSAASSLGGAVEYAGELLGAPFAIAGEVVARRQARPHARLPDREPRPATAASSRPATASTPPRRTARRDDVAAAVNVGVRPTFETGRGELIEAYLIDFDGDLYGSELAHRVPQAPARRAALRRRRRARRADGPRRRGRARGDRGAAERRPRCYRSRRRHEHADAGTQAGDRRPVRRERHRTRATPVSRSRC